MLPRGMVMRVNKMITKEKMLWSAIKLSQLILLRNVWRSVWRIYMWTLGLKGLIDVWLYHSKWKKKTAVPMLFSMIYLNIMWMSIQSTSHENKQQKLMQS